ncbi:heavy-metal-associated domain-containing protein [Promicromonospora sukumoe]|uniref:heavy-metal-associated domain-containing protein n=1 Tax=Promicromonospora sukumoe TaxID=88382 RepID=UPI0037C7A35A
MNAPQRLGLYGGGLAALFAVTFAVAGAVVPQASVDAWSASAEAGPDAMEMDGTEMPGDAAGHEQAGAADAHGQDEAADADGSDGAHGSDGAADAHGSGADPASVRGLALEQDGLLLSPVTAPDEVGERGTLSFSVTDADGAAVTAFETEHDKELHLVVVRSDGERFRHVHPTMSADGVWSIPWTWAEAGTYRVFTDFVPAASGENVTLSRAVEVAGPVDPRPATAVSASDTTGGYIATLTGDLSTSGESTLTATVTRDGEPVTGLEPYLGAYGHLVALRDGDLAYLHVHPEGDEPEPGTRSGPDVTFMTEAPTSGRYLLYLDFKVDGDVHTARFVVDTEGRG